MWSVELTKQAENDLQKLKSASLLQKVRELIKVLAQNPYTPPYEKLKANYRGYYSRRINLKHRMIYEIDEQTKTVVIITMWSHYND